MATNEAATAVFGGGCFWCTEAVFKMLKGVIAVTPGYAGGTAVNPTYESVSGGETGHAEVIEIRYDPAAISYKSLLTVFFAAHDATTPNRQGSDIGPQYRSVILYTTPEQRRAAQDYVADLATLVEKRIVTEVKPLEAFYPAEEYHVDYYANNPNKPYCSFSIAPKLEKLRTKFAKLLKE